MGMGESAPEPLDEIVRRQIAEILAKAGFGETAQSHPRNLQFIAEILNLLIQYNIREDVPQEALDSVAAILREAGFPNATIDKLVKDVYNILPTREMLGVMNKAVEFAKPYLLSLADEIVNGVPYLTTVSGEHLELTIGTPRLDGQKVEIPLFLLFRWRRKSIDKGTLEHSVNMLYSKQNVAVENRNGVLQVKGPSKEELKRSVLEAALDYFASPKPGGNYIAL